MRLAFVIDRYWPFMTPSARVLDVVIRHLLFEGHEVQLLTARGDRGWAESITVRDIPVRRFGAESWNMFSRKTLGQRIAAWLSDHADRWDLLVVCDTVPGGESLFEVADRLGRATLHCFFVGGEESRCSQLLCPAMEQRLPKTQSKLHRFGVWHRRGHWVVGDPRAVGWIKQRNPDAEVSVWNLGMPERRLPQAEEVRSQKQTSRKALDAIPASRLFGRCRTMVAYHGSWALGATSQHLWEWTRQVVERDPDVGILLLGDGPAWHSTQRMAHEASLEDRLLFPGYLNDLEDLRRAADALVYPQSGEFLIHDWLATIAAGTPVVLVENEGLSWLCEQARVMGHSLSDWAGLKSLDVDAWVDGVEQVIRDPSRAALQVDRLQECLAEVLSQQATLEQFEALLEGLC